MIEKWEEMSKRHKEERRKILEYCKAHRMTQKEAAEFLQTSLANLNKYIKRNGIKWSGQQKAVRKTVKLSPTFPRVHGRSNLLKGKPDD